MSKLCVGIGLCLLPWMLGACGGDATESGEDGSVPRGNFGSVYVKSSDLGASGSSSAGAGFIHAYDTFCPMTEVEGCTLVHCNFGAPSTASFVSAGDITVSGGLREITLSAESDNTYPTDSASEMLFQGGDELEVQVAGSGDVPAFEASIVAPFAATITAPDLSSALVIDRASPFAVSWTGWQSGDISVSIVASQKNDEGSPTHVYTLQCSFDGAAGSGAIPTSVLGVLPATGENDSATVAIAVQTIVEVDAGAWTPVRLSAASSAGTPAGTPAQAQAELR